jgi:acyl-CoA thioesterase
LIPIFLKKDYWKKIVDEFPNNMELNKEFLNYFEDIAQLEKLVSKLN